MQIFNTLAPVVLLVALGFLLRWRGFMPEPIAQWTSSFTYWLALPVLLFMEASASKLDFHAHAGAVIVMIAMMLVSIAIGYVAARAMRLPPPSAAAVVQAGYRGNLAYVGIPLVVYSLGEGNKAALATTVLVIACTIPFYNVSAVCILLGIRHRLSAASVLRVAGQVVTNPLIIGCVAGLVAAWAGVKLPVALSRTLDPLGKMSLPLALLSIGASLNVKEVHGRLPSVSVATIIKVAMCPLIGFALAGMMGVRGDDLHIVLLLLATPTAAASYVMADNMGADTHLTAGAIVATTLASVVPIIMINLMMQ